MIKTMAIIRGTEKETYTSFHKRIGGLIEQLLELNDPAWLSYTITLEKPPGFAVIPFQKSLIAVISIHTRTAAPLENLLNAPGISGCYRVTEAFPIRYEKSWPDGDPTPGVCLLTLFRKKKNIEYDRFIDRWHNGHSPLTLKIHPVFHYSRNTINESLMAGPKVFDGIVEEHCKSRRDLVNPFRFFGKPWMVPVNMMRVLFDVRSFLDYPSIESYYVTEVVVRS